MLAHVQIRIADDPAEIIMEILMVLGVQREDIFAQEPRPGDVDVRVTEAFAVPENMRRTVRFDEVEGRGNVVVRVEEADCSVLGGVFCVTWCEDYSQWAIEFCVS
jgi:hypothetical protein